MNLQILPLALTMMAGPLIMSACLRDREAARSRSPPRVMLRRSGALTAPAVVQGAFPASDRWHRTGWARDGLALRKPAIDPPFPTCTPSASQDLARMSRDASLRSRRRTGSGSRDDHATVSGRVCRRRPTSPTSPTLPPATRLVLAPRTWHDPRDAWGETHSRHQVRAATACPRPVVGSQQGEGTRHRSLGAKGKPGAWDS